MLICSEIGQCEGVILGAESTVSEVECIAMCVENVNCQWYSFNTDQNACFTFVDCDTVDTTAVDTVYGQRECREGNITISIHRAHSMNLIFLETTLKQAQNQFEFNHIRQLLTGHPVVYFLYFPNYFVFLATCPTGWILQEFDGINYCYYYKETGMYPTDAEANCLSMDSQLASIHSQEENDFIQGKIEMSKL